MSWYSNGVSRSGRSVLRSRSSVSPPCYSSGVSRHSRSVPGYNGSVSRSSSSVTRSSKWCVQVVVCHVPVVKYHTTTVVRGAPVMTTSCAAGEIAKRPMPTSSPRSSGSEEAGSTDAAAAARRISSDETAVNQGAPHQQQETGGKDVQVYQGSQDRDLEIHTLNSLAGAVCAGCVMAAIAARVAAWSAVAPQTVRAACCGVARWSVGMVMGRWGGGGRGWGCHHQHHQY